MCEKSIIIKLLFLELFVGFSVSIKYLARFQNFFSIVVFQGHELLEVTAEHLTFVVLQDGIISVKPPSHSWGILSSSAQGMRCATCNNSSCLHMKFVLQSVDTESCPDFVLHFNDTLERSPKCLSYKPIRFNRPGAVKGLIPVGDDVLSADESFNYSSLRKTKQLAQLRRKTSPAWRDYGIH